MVQRLFLAWLPGEEAEFLKASQGWGISRKLRWPGWRSNQATSALLDTELETLVKFSLVSRTIYYLDCTSRSLWEMRVGGLRRRGRIVESF